MVNQLSMQQMTRDNAQGLWRSLRFYMELVEVEMGAFALPEGVLAEWMGGNADVHAIWWGKHLVGGMALQATTRDDGKPQVWVWALGLNHGADPGVIPALNEWLKDYARNRGAVSVSMKSNRRGWERKLAPLGWKPALVEYKLEV